MATILITRGLPPEGFAVLSGHNIIAPPLLEAFSEDELLRHIPDADAVVAASALSRRVISAGGKLKIIANYGAGYDSVDIRAAAEMGIPVTNIPEAVTRDTAELTLGLMLAVSRRIGEMNLRLRQEEPESLFGTGRHMGFSLHGRTLGIIGCGRIGARVAELARAFGMHVIGYSRRGVDPSVAESVSMDALLARADIITLHCPLTDETRGLIGQDAFARMRPGTMFINTSRGAVADHDALLAALDRGIIAGAGLDVFPDEPHIPEALLRHPNVVCTPHIGTNTHQSRREMAHACSLQLLDALAGRRPENIVNGL